MSRTKAELRTLNMSAARWQALADIARAIVPDDERPMTATKGSEWQRNVMLRWIADGRAMVVVVEDKKGEMMDALEIAQEGFAKLLKSHEELRAVVAKRDAMISALTELLAETTNERDSLRAIADGRATVEWVGGTPAD